MKLWAIITYSWTGGEGPLGWGGRPVRNRQGIEEEPSVTESREEKKCQEKVLLRLGNYV